MTEEHAKQGDGSTRAGQSPAASSDGLEARRTVLQEALEDVEADNRELRAQLAVLAETCEELIGGVDRSTSTARMSATVQPSGVAAWIKRVARALVRATVGTARRLWQVGDPGQRYAVAVLPTEIPASRLPTISVVLLTSPESVAVGPPKIIQNRTTDGVEVAAWDAVTGELIVWPATGTEAVRRSARSREELLGLLTGEWLMTVPFPPPRLPATLLENLQWLVATERLQYVRVPVRPRDLRHVDGADSDLLLCARGVFDPVHLMDVGRLAQAARSHPVLGKTVRLVGPIDAASPRPVAFAGHGRGAVVAVGRYEMWALNRSGPVEQPVATLPAGATPADGADPRPAVVVLAAASLDGGVDRMVSGLIQTLGDEIRFLLVTTSADNTLDLTRAALLENTGCAVYELGSTLDPSVWPSAVARIAGRCGACSMLVIGWDERLGPVVGGVRSLGVRLVALAIDVGGADVPANVWLATSVAVGEALARAGILQDCVEVAQVEVAQVGMRRPGQYGREHAVRAALGVPEGHRLVLTVGDLVPRCRPEDVVLAADLLRDEDQLFFVLVGEGPLAGQIADLTAYLDLANVRVCPQEHSVTELVAAADVVLDPAESAPARPAVLAALAAGRPVVATRGGGISGLQGLLVVHPVGDPEALATALRRVLRGQGPAADPTAARELIQRRCDEGVETLRRVLLEGGSDGVRS